MKYFLIFSLFAVQWILSCSQEVAGTAGAGNPIEIKVSLDSNKMLANPLARKLDNAQFQFKFDSAILEFNQVDLLDVYDTNKVVASLVLPFKTNLLTGVTTPSIQFNQPDLQCRKVQMHMDNKEQNENRLPHLYVTGKIQSTLGVKPFQLYLEFEENWQWGQDTITNNKAKQIQIHLPLFNLLSNYDMVQCWNSSLDTLKFSESGNSECQKVMEYIKENLEHEAHVEVYDSDDLK